MTHQLLILIFDCIWVGVGAGLVYGIFGSGSGLIMMPGFYYVLRHFHLVAGNRMQVAVATTAMASGILGYFAARYQAKNHNIDFASFKKLVPGISLGCVSAVLLLNVIPSYFLKKMFAVVVIMVAIWLWLYNQDKDKKQWSLQGFINFVLTTFIGLFWYLLGVAVFTVPYLHKCGIDMRRSVGTSTITGSIFSLAAGILLIITGYFKIGFSWHQLGFLNLPLLFSSVIPSAIAAHYGSKISVKMPQHLLKKISAGLILLVGILMI